MDYSSPMKQQERTKTWERYERGRTYNGSLSPDQYRLVNTNIEFFAGNQWINIPQTSAMSRLPKPTFNIIKRVVSLFVASLTATATTISFDTLSYYSTGPAMLASPVGPTQKRYAAPGSAKSVRDATGETGRGRTLDEKGNEINLATYATAEVQNLFEKFKMEYRVRDALFDGAVTGDYCAHFYFDPYALPYGGAFGPYRGEIQMEMVDGINVMFGNPNTHDVQKQPYILLIGRDTVENLREEKRRFDKAHRKSGDAEKPELIQPDSEFYDMPGIGGKTELIQSDDGSDKCLYAYLYTKVTKEEDAVDPETGETMMEPETDSEGRPIPLKDDDGKPILGIDGAPQFRMKPMKRFVTSVHVTKSTKYADIYTDVDTGLSLYPVAWGNWERQKNQYHGRALVTGIIPNQIYINSMFAMVMRHQQLLGFQKVVYNADLIGRWDNEIGQAIGVHGVQPGQRIGDIATILQAPDMSNQIILAIDKAIQLTKECLGATDVQMGSVKPDNTSALMVLQSNSEVPLENPRANLHEWIEDIGAILLDMMGTYYGRRPIIRDREFTEIAMGPNGVPILDPMTGMMQTSTVVRKVMEEFDFEQFKNIWLNMRVDVGATTYFSEIAVVQTLDNLRRDGTLDVISYLERIPDKLIPKKDELIQKLKQTLAQPMANAQAGGAGAPPPELMTAAPAMGGALDEEKAIQQMPINIQDDFSQMPQVARDALLAVQGE